MLENVWLSQCDPFPMEQDHRRVKQRVRLMLGCKRLDYAAVSLAGIELIGGVPDVDMRLLKFWRINSLGIIASISRTPPGAVLLRNGNGNADA